MGESAGPRFLHLNGPAGIGKSTIAQMYADRHPMVLNLDIDRIRTLIGGWRDTYLASGSSARALAHAMARTHLSAGHDVVMPQFVGRAEEAQRFADTAAETLGPWPDWHEEVTGIVATSGGTALLEQMYDQLVAVLRQRPSARVVRSTAEDPLATYEAVERVLALPHG